MGRKPVKRMSRREFLRQAAAGAVAAAAMGSGAGRAAAGGPAPSSTAGPRSPSASQLPKGVKVVWDLAKAQHDTTATRGRICINGLWRWQPAQQPAQPVP